MAEIFTAKTIHSFRVLFVGWRKMLFNLLHLSNFGLELKNENCFSLKKMHDFSKGTLEC